MPQREGVVLIGPPGSGKSTISERLMKDKDIAAVETGNILREETEKESEYGKLIRESMSSGEMVPLHIVKDLILEKLKGMNQKYILFDGFPRVNDQVKTFHEILEDQDINLHSVIILQLDDDTIMKRITGRRICSNCGAIYNIHFDPPDEEDKCKRCGGKLVKRKDDTPEIVKERINNYKDNTLPAAYYFKNNFPDKTLEVDGKKGTDQISGEIRIFLN